MSAYQLAAVSAAGNFAAAVAFQSLLNTAIAVAVVAVLLWSDA